MTQLVYIDSLFFLNFSLDFILLGLVSDLLGLWCSRRRQTAAAALGGLLAVLLYIPRVSPLPALLLRLGSCLAVCLAAFPKAGRAIGRCCGLLFGLTACLAGAVTALVLLTGGLLPAGVRNGVIDLRVPVWRQLAAAGACWCGLRMLLRGGTFSPGRRHRQLTIRHGGDSVRVKALVDTGHFLREPLTGRSVILVDRAALEPLLPLPPDRDPVRLLEALSALGPGFSLMGFHTAGARDGLLVTWRPSAILEGDSPLEGFIIGIAPAPIALDDGCRAIIGGQV